jgi:hypothetical protein
MKCTALKKEKVMILTTLFICSAIILISYFSNDKYYVNIYHLMSHFTDRKKDFVYFLIILICKIVSVVITPIFVLILIKNAHRKNVFENKLLVSSYFQCIFLFCLFFLETIKHIFCRYTIGPDVLDDMFYPMFVWVVNTYIVIPLCIIFIGRNLVGRKVSKENGYKNKYSIINIVLCVLIIIKCVFNGIIVYLGSDFFVFSLFFVVLICIIYNVQYAHKKKKQRCKTNCKN